jgi:pimeloyl-ACP methyl ester carboxylesterase
MMIKVPRGELFVRLKGDPAKPILVNLHGGPGGSSAFEVLLMDPYMGNYLVAYLDQRGCGKSTECRDPDLLTMNQYVKDLDIVIDTLLNKYNHEKVNLMGSSWGGLYGFLYLLENQEKVNAFASIDGKVNHPYQNQSLINHEIDLAVKLLEQEPPEKRKEELSNILVELERIQKGDFADFYEDVLKLKHTFPPKLGFNAYYADTSKIIKPNEILSDSTKMKKMNFTLEEFYEAMRKGGIVNKAFRNNRNYNTLNIENQLSAINIPVLVVQGEEDYIVGKEQAQKIYNGLTNVNENDKELHILPNVGHSPIIEAPEQLMTIVNGFLGKYNPE